MVEYMNELINCVVCKKDIPRKKLYWDTIGSYTETCEDCHNKKVEMLIPNPYPPVNMNDVKVGYCIQFDYESRGMKQSVGWIEKVTPKMIIIDTFHYKKEKLHNLKLMKKLCECGLIVEERSIDTGEWWNLCNSCFEKEQEGIYEEEEECCEKCYLIECCCEADRLQVIKDDERATADGYVENGDGRWVKKNEEEVEEEDEEEEKYLCNNCGHHFEDEDDWEKKCDEFGCQECSKGYVKTTWVTTRR